MDFINMPAVTTMFMSAIVGLGVWFAKDARQVRKDEKRSNDLIVGAILVLIRNQLVRAHASAVSRSHITISEKHSFLEMNLLYRNLGGNGPTSHLVDDIQRLNTVPD